MSIISFMIYALWCIWVILLCAVALPVFAGVVVAQLLSERLPIFYRQKRIGKRGRPFWLYKFRTMRQGAQAQQSKLTKYNESSGPTFKIYDDPRFTPLGKFLSHTGLDELPQLYNVLRGEMALIGPRPLPVGEAAKLEPWMRKREMVLPGIISPAILTGRYHEDFTAWMKSDVEYAQNKSFWRDTLLGARTIVFLFRLFVKELA